MYNAYMCLQKCVSRENVCFKGFSFMLFKDGSAVNCTQEHYLATELLISEGVFKPLIHYFQTEPDCT